MKAARARDCGLPNLDAEIAFWKKAFGLDDWTITARYVEELKSRCRPILGLLPEWDVERQTAVISVRRPRKMSLLRVWPEIIVHEMMHLVWRAHRVAGFTIEEEHRIINILAPAYAKTKRTDLAAATRMAAGFAKAVCALGSQLATAPAHVEPDRIAAMKLPPPERGHR